MEVPGRTKLRVESYCQEDRPSLPLQLTLLNFAFIRKAARSRLQPLWVALRAGDLSFSGQARLSTTSQITCSVLNQSQKRNLNNPNKSNADVAFGSSPN